MYLYIILFLYLLQNHLKGFTNDEIFFSKCSFPLFALIFKHDSLERLPSLLERVKYLLHSQFQFKNYEYNSLFRKQVNFRVGKC